VKKKVKGAEQGFGFAFNGSTGMEKSPATAGARLPTFKSPAQIAFFSYNEAGGVRAAGRHTRNGAFTYLHTGPLGATAEWFSNSQVVSRAGAARTVNTGAWLVGAQYSLTGEPSAQEGLVPQAEFNPDKGHWGAWQFGARAARVQVGDEAFPVYADSTVAPHSALEIGIGLNWYMTRTTKIQLAYEHTAFEGGAKVGNRKAERFAQLRWQAYF
jgi:phosphate-selective porin